MRVRPVFWCILAFVCCTLLVFAGLLQEHVPAFIQVRVDAAAPVPVGYTVVELHLSDPQNLPIEAAQVIPTARMTNMAMAALATSVTALGQGNFRVQFALSMGGPWKIALVAHADGFDDARQTLLLQVPSPVGA